MEPDVKNLFRLPSSLPGPEDDESVDILSRVNDVRVERIVSTGQASPPGFWYDQDEDEWVVLLSGDARLRYEDGSVLSLNAGDFLFIPAHVRHRIDGTSRESPCIWLAFFRKKAPQ